MTTVATWNVNSIRIRLDHLRTWVNERKPDIVLLQELKCNNADFPRAAIHDLGYNFEIFGQKSYNGVAILSKSPINDVVMGIPGFADESARYIEAEIDGGIFASVYVPNGQEVGSDKYDYKLNFMQALTDHLSTHIKEDQHVVVGGDYNIAPFTEDVFDPDVFERSRILCSLKERQSFYRLKNLGFIDALRTVYPCEKFSSKAGENASNQANELFSWWDYRAGSYENNKGYRIDHLLIAPKTADCMNGAGIDSDIRALSKPSDHAPVWLEYLA